MKKAIVSLILLLLILPFSLPVYSSTSPKDHISVPIRKNKDNGGRPDGPGQFLDYIHAYISEYVLTVVFDEPEGMAEVLVKNELGEVCAYAVGSTESEITLSAPLNVGVFSLEISTSLGNEYIGYFFGE